MIDDTRQTVARIVIDHSECASVFQRHRIDYCCSGALTLADAACERGVDVRPLVSDLERAIAERTGAPADDPRALATAVVARAAA